MRSEYTCADVRPVLGLDTLPCEWNYVTLTYFGSGEITARFNQIVTINSIPQSQRIPPSTLAAYVHTSGLYDWSTISDGLMRVGPQNSGHISSMWHREVPITTEWGQSNLLLTV